LAALTAWCDAHGVRLISDEIYHGITYPGPPGPSEARPGEAGPPGRAAAPGQAGEAGASASTGSGRRPGGWSEAATPGGAEHRAGCVVSSFSTYGGMTGWRLGWMLMPEDLRPSIDALAGNIALCPPAPAARAALAAFTDSSYAEADARVASFARTRAHLLERVP